MEKALAPGQLHAGAHRRLLRVLAIVGACLLAGSGPKADAAVVPPELVPTPATIVTLLAFNLFPPNPNPVEVLTFGEHQLFGPGGRLRIDSALFPSPFLHASVPDIRDNFFGRVSATLVYEVVVLGPPGSTASVPVRVHASGEAQGSALPPPLGNGAFALKATWSIENAISGVPVFAEGIVTPQLTDKFFDSFDHIVNLDLTANQRFRVRMVADVGIANGMTNGGFGSAHAFIDPVFSFAPGVGEEFSFVFSEGVGNLPVPEPGTFGLFAAGLLMLGLLKRTGTGGQAALEMR